MGIADELARLQQLHAQGSLSDEEFARAKARVLAGEPAPGGDDPLSAVGRLRRSRSDRLIGGVCGGIARISGVETWIWRLIAVGLVLCFGTGVLLYLLLWIFVPEE